MSDDLLEALLRTALAEGALDADALPRFAQALRDRAALIVADRLLPLEERADAFQTETAWRAGVMAGLEEEKKAWLEAHARLAADREAQVSEVLALQQERQALIEQHQRHRREVESLAGALSALRTEKDVASEAHDRLLAHHRATVAHVVETLRGASGDLPWRYRRARAAVLDLLRLLEKDTP
jgi:hypothetical protein